MGEPADEQHAIDTMTAEEVESWEDYVEQGIFWVDYNDWRMADE